MPALRWHLRAVRDTRRRNWRYVSVWGVVVVLALVVLSHGEEAEVLGLGGESVLIEATADGKARYCSGTVVVTDEVVTAAHCVRDARVTLLSWRGQEWAPGRVSLLDGDVARIAVAGIGAVGGVTEAALSAGVLEVAGWQGKTRDERSVHRCETSQWSVVRSKLHFVCGFSNGASGAGVLLDGELVAVVTSKHGAGMNSATVIGS